MTKKNSSKVDGLHRYLNDVTITVGIFVAAVIIVGVAAYREYNNHAAQQQKVIKRCPEIAAKFDTKYRVDDIYCEIQTIDSEWVSVNIH